MDHIHAAAQKLALSDAEEVIPYLSLTRLRKYS